MSWSREDIVSDIKRKKYDIDTNLPYPHLLRRYRGSRHTRRLVAGIHGCPVEPPKPSSVNFETSTEPQCPSCGADLKWNHAQYECTKCDYTGMKHSAPNSETKEWTFAIKDMDDALHLIQDYSFIGTKQEAVNDLKRIANEWEQKTGKWCYLLMLHSIGNKTTR